MKQIGLDSRTAIQNHPKSLNLRAFQLLSRMSGLLRKKEVQFKRPYEMVLIPAVKGFFVNTLVTIIVHTANSTHPAVTPVNILNYICPAVHSWVCSGSRNPTSLQLAPFPQCLFTLTADTGILALPEEDKAQPKSPICELRCAGLKTALYD